MDDGLSAQPDSRAHAVPFVGGSEMAARMAEFDWSRTSVAPVEQWPQSLRTAVGICLSSRYPTVSDNGRWKPPPQCPGNRGHGIRLMDALLDAVHLTRTEYGTTVEMFKELC